MSERVTIEIYGQTYSIAGELRPEYMEELAAYVDGKMREVARLAGAVDSVRVAVLAALAIADELHTIKQSGDESREKLRERAERCLKLVERALQQSA